MARAKKTPVYQYGIEITKPHSREMYSHNEEVALEMKAIITQMWDRAWNEAETHFSEDLEEDQQGLEFGDHDWSNANETMHILSKAVTVTGYGSGFNVNDVQDDFIRDLENSENWRMHELYQELCDDKIVPSLRFEMVGHTNSYNDGSTYGTEGHSTVSPVVSDDQVVGNISAK